MRNYHLQIEKDVSHRGNDSCDDSSDDDDDDDNVSCT